MVYILGGAGLVSSTSGTDGTILLELIDVSSRYVTLLYSYIKNMGSRISETLDVYLKYMILKLYQEHGLQNIMNS